MLDFTNLHRSVKAIHVLTSCSCPTGYSPLRVSRSCAIDCTRPSNCVLPTWACSTSDHMNLNAEKAEMRQGTEVRFRHCCTMSIVEVKEQ